MPVSDLNMDVEDDILERISVSDLNMNVQDDHLERSLLELHNPNMTPEKALELLSSASFSSAAYRRGENEPAVIFLAYIRFVTTRQQDVCVDGIWENILRKAIMYSRNFSASQITHIRRTYDPNVCLRSWLLEALSIYSKCPNPYMRLGLFRLIRIFQMPFINEETNQIQSVCVEFIRTISDIQPHRLYPNDDGNERLFDVRDLRYMVDRFRKDIIRIISTDIVIQINKNNEVFVDSMETRFLSHCIQLIGVSTVMAGSIHGQSEMESVITISHCGTALCAISTLVDFGEYLPGMSRQKQFRCIFSRPPFHSYLVETIHDYTAALMNNKMPATDKNYFLTLLRGIIAGNLEECSKTSDLPRLLFSRQMQGSMLVRQHSLLIPLLLKNMFLGQIDEDSYL